MNSEKNKKYLILDISLRIQLIFLTDEKKILAFKKNIFPNDFVVHMVPLIDLLLKEQKITLKNLTGIIVGIGPGSFTGTKIAVLTSKILALEFCIPLYKISSLLLLSSGYLVKRKNLTPKIYARSDFFYCFSFKNNNFILSENIYENHFLRQFNNHILLEENNFKISLSQVFIYMKRVWDPHTLLPNYYS